MAYNLTFTNTGIVVPSASEIKSDLEAMFKSAFPNINLDSATPQGQLLMSLTTIINDQNTQILEVVNSFNPANAVNNDTSGNLWQDAIGGIYLLQRQKATKTVVQCTVTGVPNTVIPIGSQAISENGDLFNLVTKTIIPESGSILTDFQADVAGNIPCPANTLNRIYTQVNGWDTVNNNASGIVGSNVENRESFENRRKQTLGANASSTLDAVTANLFETKDVVDVVVRENDTDENKTIQGYDLIPHSMYAVVLGGTDVDIAKAIVNKKSGGCQTQGQVQVSYTSTYGSPINVKFDRPTPQDISVNITAKRTGYTPDNIEKLVSEAIINNISGLAGDERLHIGESLYSSRLIEALSSLPIRIVDIEIENTEATPSAEKHRIDFNLNQLAIIESDLITINWV